MENNILESQNFIKWYQSNYSRRLSRKKTTINFKCCKCGKVMAVSIPLKVRYNLEVIRLNRLKAKSDLNNRDVLIALSDSVSYQLQKSLLLSLCPNCLRKEESIKMEGLKTVDEEVKEILDDEGQGK